MTNNSLIFKQRWRLSLRCSILA